MSRLTALLSQVAKTDVALADDLRREVAVLSRRRPFGLNFERRRRADRKSCLGTYPAAVGPDRNLAAHLMDLRDVFDSSGTRSLRPWVAGRHSRALHREARVDQVTRSLAHRTPSSIAASIRSISAVGPWRLTAARTTPELAVENFAPLPPACLPQARCTHSESGTLPTGDRLEVD